LKGGAAVKVLFIDDEADFLEIIIKRMKKREVDATGVSNPEQALGMIDQNLFDVVVLDARMPGGKNGIDILKEIKCRRPLVEVIMLTGHATLDAAREGMENGAFDYMVKPADLDELIYKIKDAHQKKTLQESKIKGINDIMKNSKQNKLNSLKGG
jgi:DNA-binding NtrC family response regulator